MTSAARTELDTLCVTAIRTLSMDAVQAANSGHPGAPMGLAPVAYCLRQQVLRSDPQDPIWPNRDRFVLSAGHASMLLYSLLHPTGVKAVRKDYETHGVRPPTVRARVSVEQASTFGRSKYVGDTGHSVGMRSFGASARLKQLVKEFGFTVENVVDAAREQIRQVRRGAEQ